MPSSSWQNMADITRLHRLGDDHISALAALLIDCVHGGASVGFMQPLPLQHAQAFWSRIAQRVRSQEHAILVAEDSQGIIGTVQLVLSQPDNQPHRADLIKMLVHRRARRQGVGAALMQAAVTLAQGCGKTLLVLDTIQHSDAARLYGRLGWTLAGHVPDYALMPQGGLRPTSIYYREVPA